MSKLLQKIEYYRFLKTYKVRAGWDVRTKNKDGERPCVYMRHNEFGTKNIPPRPFMRNTISINRSTWIRMIQKGMQSSMSGQRLANLLGIRLKGDIQKTIVSGVPPPNSPVTVKAKAKRGNNGGTLRDTLFALQQVTYTVKET